jgi:hypothetical protein
MSNLAGLSRTACAAACGRDGCIILGNRLPRCCHPKKGGPPLELVNDRVAMEAFDRVCVAINVRNIYELEKTAS